MLCLNMKSTNAVLGMDIKHLKMNMNYDDAKLSTEYIPPKSGVAASAVEVEINQYPCRAAYGMQSAMDATVELAKEAKQKVTEGTGRRASEGTQVMMYGHKKNVFADIAKSNITKPENRTLTLGAIPEPIITVKPSQIVGKNDVGKYAVTIKPSPVQYDYQQGEVSYYLKQKASLKMWVTEGKYDIKA